MESTIIESLIALPVTLDFNEVNYAAGCSSITLNVSISNPTENSSKLILEPKIVYSNRVDEFPVELVIDKDSLIEIYPGETLEVQFQLKATADGTANWKNTSYYNVSRRFQLLYYCASDVEVDNIIKQSLSFSYTAKLCTSVMFIDKLDINFDIDTIGEVYCQEIMIWNRSESTLKFTIEDFVPVCVSVDSPPQDIVVDSLVASEGQIILANSTSTGEVGEALVLHQIYEVPSFAPMSIIAKVSSNTHGDFNKSFTFKNINNSDNTSTVNIKGKVYSRKPSRIAITVLDRESGIEIEDANTNKVINLGDHLCGKKITRSLSIFNKQKVPLNITLSLEGDGVNEASISWKTDSGKKILLEESAKAALVEETKLAPVSALSYYWKDAYKRDGSFQWSYEEGSSKPKVSLSTLCSQLFSQEYAEADLSGAAIADIFGEDTELLSVSRPFQSPYLPPVASYEQKGQSQSPAIRAVALDEAKILAEPTITESAKKEITIKPNKFQTLQIEVFPSKEFQKKLVSDTLRLAKRTLKLVIFAMDSHDNDNEMKEDFLPLSIQLEFKACCGEISIVPTVYDLGISYWGETYFLNPTMQNMCDLPIALRPSVQAAGCSLSVSEILLAPLEKKEVSIKLVPSADSSKVNAQIAFKNGSNGDISGKLEICANAVNGEHHNLHSLFYRLTGDFLQSKHHLILGRSLVNMPHYAVIQIKNISKVPLPMKLYSTGKHRISVASFSSQSSLINDDVSALMGGGGVGGGGGGGDVVTSGSGSVSDMINAFDDLRWGNSVVQSSNANSSRSKYDDRINNRQRSIDIENAKGSLSDNVKALDITPIVSKRGSDFDKKYGSLGGDERKSMMVVMSGDTAFSRVEGNTRKLSELPASWDLLSSSENILMDVAQIIEISNILKQNLLPCLFDDSIEETNLVKFRESLQRLPLASISRDILKPFLQDAGNNSTSSSISEISSSHVKTFQEIFRKIRIGAGFISTSMKPPALSTSESSDNTVEEATSSALIHSEVLEVNGTRDWILSWTPNCADITEDLTNKQIADILMLKIEGMTAFEFQSTLHEASQDYKDISFLSKHFNNEEDFVTLPSQALVVRSECFLSEMTVVPRNVNFGKIVVGDVVNRYLNIINNSSVACLYSIEKTGSIASGFLSISEGRKGIIPPFSTKVVEIKLKPMMPCVLEEELIVCNILNPDNEQRVLMRSKVSRAEAFSLSLISSTIVPQEEEEEEEDSIYSRDNIHYKDIGPVFTQLLKSLGIDSPPNSADEKDTQRHYYSYMGSSAVGKNPTVEVKFRIKNLTSRTRHFIIDGTSNDAIELLDASQFTALANADSDDSLEIMSALRVLTQTPHSFIPIPETLQNVLCMRCQFNSEIVISQSSNEEDENTKILYDQLEKFQQKLKIAVRKGKAEKIAKYQKKISQTITQLSSKAVSKPSESAKSRPKLDLSAQRNPTYSDDTELAHVLVMGAEQELEVNIKVSYLPGLNYRPWKGLLPFIGRIRIFEAKNEDYKKSITFGSLLYSSIIEMQNPMIGTRSRVSSVDSDSAPDLLPPMLQDSREMITKFDARDQLSNPPFLVTIPAWCSYLTKQVFPKYKKMPNNTLGACIKLARSSKDRSLSGMFLITSLHGHTAKMEITIDELLSGSDIKESSQYKVYDHKQYGTMVLKYKDTEDAILDEDVKSVYHDLSHNTFVSNFIPKAKAAFTLKWNPPQFLETPTEEFRLFGALKVTFGASDNTYYRLILPFVCAYQHKSIIEIDKYCQFQDVHIASYSTTQLLIKNSSETEDLHYVLTLEQVAEKYSTQGSIQIMSGKTGVIPAAGSKTITLLFYATSLGRFEQRIWVQNLNDGFDQKRIVAQANVMLSPTRFVTFPDLDPEEVNGKRKVLDFGKVQYESPFPPCSCSKIELADKSGQYVLRIKNVSGRTLAVTAISNLRKQCFVFADMDMYSPAVNVPIGAHETKELLVVFRPALPNKKHYLFQDKHLSNINDNLQREVTGGIRLVFLSGDKEIIQASETSSDDVKAQEVPIKEPNADSKDELGLECLPQRKLFESAISFKAVVGQSILSASLVSPKVLRVRLGHDIGHQIVELLIKNESKVFPLIYCICSALDEREAAVYTPSSQKALNTYLSLEDNKAGYLSPQQEQIVRLRLIGSPQHYGLFGEVIKITNLSTNEAVEVIQTIYVHSNRVKLYHELSDIHSDKEWIRDAPLSTSFSACLRVEEKAQSSSLHGKSESKADRASIPLRFLFSQPKEIAVWMMKNVHSTSIHLQAVTNLPVSINITAVEMDESRDDIAASPSQFADQLARFNSHLSFQSNQNNQSFHICGDSFELRAGAVVKVALSYAANLEMDFFRESELDILWGGHTLVLEGFVGFLESNNLLQSISVSNHDNEQRPSSSELHELQDAMDEFLRVLGGAPIKCSFALPLLKIKPREINFGQLMEHQLTSMEFHISSSASLETIACFELIPGWLQVKNVQIRHSKEDVLQINTASLQIIDKSLISLIEDPSLSLYVCHRDRFYLKALPGASYTATLVAHAVPDIDPNSYERNICFRTLPTSAWQYILEDLELCAETPLSFTPERLIENCIYSQGVKLSCQVSKDMKPQVGVTSSDGKTKLQLLNIKEEANKEYDTNSVIVTQSDKGICAKCAKKYVANFEESIHIPFLISSDLSALCEKLVNDLVKDGEESFPDTVALPIHDSIVTKKSMKLSINNLSNFEVGIFSEFVKNEEISDYFDVSFSWDNFSDSDSVVLGPNQSQALKLRVTIPKHFKLSGRLLRSLREKSNILRENLSADPLKSSGASGVALNELSRGERAGGTTSDSALGSGPPSDLALKIGSFFFKPERFPRLRDDPTSSSASRSVETQAIDVIFNINIAPVILPVDPLNISHLKALDKSLTLSFSCTKVPTSPTAATAVATEAESEAVEDDEDEEGNFKESAEAVEAPEELEKQANAESSDTSFKQVLFNFSHDQQRVVYLFNPTDKIMGFSFKVGTYRFPGLSFDFPFPPESFVDDLFSTDTLTISADVKQGEIPPSSARRVVLSVCSGSPAEATEVVSIQGQERAEADSSLGYTVLSIPIEIGDSDDTAHPNAVIIAQLYSDSLISTFPSQPVSGTSRKKQHLDSVLTDGGGVSDSLQVPSLSNKLLAPIDRGSSPSLLKEEFDPFAAQNLTFNQPPLISPRTKPMIRKRGITPHNSSELKGFIALGKQVQRNEALEWIVTLENRSSSSYACFQIECLSYPTNRSWLLLGQSRGFIAPNNSTSVVLYFDRSQLGQYVSYIVIRDMNGIESDHVIQATMRVINEERAKPALLVPDSQTGIVGIAGEPLQLSPATLWLRQFISIEVAHDNDHPQEQQEQQEEKESQGEVQEEGNCAVMLSADKPRQLITIHNHASIPLRLALSESEDAHSFEVHHVLSDAFEAIEANRGQLVLPAKGSVSLLIVAAVQPSPETSVPSPAESSSQQHPPTADSPHDKANDFMSFGEIQFDFDLFDMLRVSVNVLYQRSV